MDKLFEAGAEQPKRVAKEGLYGSKRRVRPVWRAA